MAVSSAVRLAGGSAVVRQHWALGAGSEKLGGPASAPSPAPQERISLHPVQCWMSVIFLISIVFTLDVSFIISEAASISMSVGRLCLFSVMGLNKTLEGAFPLGPFSLNARIAVPKPTSDLVPQLREMPPCSRRPRRRQQASLVACHTARFAPSGRTGPRLLGHADFLPD